MMKRLTSGMRWRAAWLLSLVYLLATLAPTFANAFAASPTSLSHHSGMRAMAAHHQQMSVYTDAHAEASAHHHDQAHEHGQTHKHDHSAPSQGDASDLQCCGVACISALPASLLSVQVPDVPKNVQLAANASDVASRAPPLLYRPPIS
jgi:hypothetical protein